MTNWFKIIVFFVSFISFSQQNGQKIAIIDMEYILKKVPEYKEAYKELQKKGAEWDNEIKKRKAIIQKEKDKLNAERPLLTNMLLEEREEEIKIMEAELLTYQQSKFGMDGDYFIQKANLVKPVQEKLINLINEYAEKKKYTLVLDKTDDTKGLLFSKKGTNITDKIVKEIDKIAKRAKLSKEEIAKLEERDRLLERLEKQKTKSELLLERQRELFEQAGGKMEEQKNLTPAQIENQKRKENAQRIRNERIRKSKEEREKRLAEQNKKREEDRIKREQQKQEKLKKIEEKRKQQQDLKNKK